jgi:hypothetical protein
MVPSRDVRAGGSAYAASRQRVRPLVRFRGAPGTRSRKTRTGMGFHPTGPAFRRPSGFRLPGSTSSREAERRPPLRFRSSSETCPCSPAPQRRASRPKPASQLVPRCSLSWALVPYDTVPDRRSRLSGDGSPRRRVPPARFGYLLGGLPPPILPARKAPERPWASPFKAFPSSQEVPLSRSLPS